MTQQRLGYPRPLSGNRESHRAPAMLVDTGQELTQLTPDAMREACWRGRAHSSRWTMACCRSGTRRQRQHPAGHGSRRDGSLTGIADRSLRTPCWQEHRRRPAECVASTVLRGGDGKPSAPDPANSVSLRAPDMKTASPCNCSPRLLPRTWKTTAC